MSELIRRSPEVREAKDVIIGELADPGIWITLSIDTQSFWPVNAQKVRFRERTIWILPQMIGFYPAVAINLPPGMGSSEARRLLMQFLSALSWAERRGFLASQFIETNRPVPRQRADPPVASVSHEFRLVYLPQPDDERALQGLALMREGRSLNHPGYAFLSYFRVLERAFPHRSKERVEWMTSQIRNMKDRDALAAIAKLTAAGILDIGEHLFRARRSAVAHANGDEFIDPDDPEQLRAVESDLPIISALAERAIEEILGVKTFWTIYDEHLYELSGFKEILGQSVVNSILNETEAEAGTMINMPLIDIRVRGRRQHRSLSALSLDRIERNGKIVRLAFTNEHSHVDVRLDLDFKNERLILDPFNSLFGRDDDTAEAAEAVVDLKMFGNEMMMNGELHIFNHETGKVIARKEAYYLTNATLDVEGAEAEVSRWRQIAEERRIPGLAFRNALNRLASRYRMSVKTSEP